MRYPRVARDTPEALGAVAIPAYVLAMGAGAVSGAADTNENTLASITIPENVLGRGGRVEVETNWAYTNSGNNKTMRVKFGATTILSHVATTTALAKNSASVMNRGATNSQYTEATTITAAAIAQAVGTAAIDTTADVTLAITGQKASAGETITLEGYTVKVYPN